ncbi:hypothetical protein RFI_06637 [Reticulomyxa filosa]|uniref:BTB domain-containing protein n=1 Tax=Reticulomyxa filosa TaxID=46433 RepID=X6NW06_RETFI|nr:hypothetical protein RFI_06637 [Reticulomyxa filosa]|eukprot:ETO30480.1 hypothetical protein RFI_06637 [Reticulomyxa filosa]
MTSANIGNSQISEFVQILTLLHSSSAFPGVANLGATLSEQLLHLFDQQKYGDIVFYFESDNTSVCAHKFVLTGRSEYYKTMLMHGSMHESKTGHIVISKDIKPDTFKAFLRYLYSDKLVVTISLNLLIELLGLCHRYREHKLFRKIEFTIIECVDSETIYDILKAAHFYEASQLSHFCKDQIIRKYWNPSWDGLESYTKTPDCPLGLLPLEMQAELKLRRDKEVVSQQLKQKP